MYAGRMVDVRIDGRGQVKDIRLAAQPGGASNAGPCSYGGQGYADGILVCQSGQQYLCERGEWISLGNACGPSLDAAAAPAPRVCVFGGATVAVGSSICRSGTTFRCVEGQWVNLGTACS